MAIRSIVAFCLPRGICMAIWTSCECGGKFPAHDDDAGRTVQCPECGRPHMLSAGPRVEFDPDEVRTSRKAVVSLVLGLLSMCFVFLAGIPAVLVGASGIRDIKRSGGRLTGRGMATAGLVLGGLGCLLTPVALAVLALPLVQASREMARRTTCVHNLQAIGLALHHYHDDTGRLPLPAITDARNTPLLSWRVAILPYLQDVGEHPVDCAALYREFHLDEPWDSPHNRTLLERMPNVYRCPTSVPADGDRPPTNTNYRVCVGEGAIFDTRFGSSIPAIMDGTMNTIMVPEAREPVPWTMPSELAFDPKGPPPAVGSAHPGGFYLVMADGSVHLLTTERATPERLRALLTRNGGEVVTVEGP